MPCYTEPAVAVDQKGQAQLRDHQNSDRERYPYLLNCRDVAGYYYGREGSPCQVQWLYRSKTTPSGIPYKQQDHESCQKPGKLRQDGRLPRTDALADPGICYALQGQKSPANNRKYTPFHLLDSLLLSLSLLKDKCKRGKRTSVLKQQKTRKMGISLMPILQAAAIRPDFFIPLPILRLLRTAKFVKQLHQSTLLNARNIGARNA